MSRSSSAARRVAVAAIDFGTTNTGFGYYLRAEHEDQAAHNIKLFSTEPTTLLLSPDSSFLAFGNDAEARYKRLTLEGKHKTHFYFQYFKMDLHFKPELSRGMRMKDANGAEQTAMHVFALAIKHVKTQLIKKIQEQMNDDIPSHRITWVLTVPAIWRHSAKQFMREAANNAGIQENQLSLALEPESAAICCKDMALRKTGGLDGIMLKAFDPGQKYIVVDCGGGTVDTTGHKVLLNGTLKEIDSASGGPWGGKLVNDAFGEFIAELVTERVFKEFKTNKPSKWIELCQEFELKKRAYNGTNDVDITLPHALVEMYEKISGEKLIVRIKNTVYSESCRFLEENLILNKKIMDRLYGKATDKINDHIEDLLKKDSLKRASSILLVGGFSESDIVKKSVTKRFGTRVRVIAPPGGGSAILKGAVMFGCDPDIIAARISPFTYGVSTRAPYDKDRHKAVKPKKVGEREVVDNVFDKHVEINSQVVVGCEFKHKRYTVINRSNPTVWWKIYQSRAKDPVFCNDRDCSAIGKLTLEIPARIKDPQIPLDLCLICRGTELEATAKLVEHKNVQVSLKFDFLDTSGYESDFTQSESLTA